jgi:hypothetical protein
MKKVCFALFMATILCCSLPQASFAQLCNAEAHSWVEAHRSDLPRTYEDFSRFPLNYRKAIYSILSPDERAMLWQDQFERLLGRSGLTAEQRDVVAEAIQLATPEVFASLRERTPSGTKLRYRQRLAELARQAESVFGKEDAGSLFATLGPSDLEFGIMRQPASGDRSGVQKSVGCSCSTVSDYCSSAFHCSGGTGCVLIRDECGTFWTYDCNGQCVVN